MSDSNPGLASNRAVNDIYATRAGLIEKDETPEGLVETPGEIPEGEHEGDPDGDPTDLVDADGQTAGDRGEDEDPGDLSPDELGLEPVESVRDEE